MCSTLLLRNNNDPFLDHIVTCDEKWILYDNRRRSVQWLNRGKAPQHFPKPKLYQRKTMVTIWYRQPVYNYDPLQLPGETITAEKYCQEIDEMHRKLQRLRSALINRKGPIHLHEHRFYGQSKPTEDISTKNLQYLNIDQALADLAYFIETKKKEKNLEKSIVIVFGGSYAGNMAAWARLKYSHLIQGALASSAPNQTKVDYEYYEFMINSLGRYSENCVESIKTAFASIEELLAMQHGPEKLKFLFNLCHVPDVKSPSDLSYFMSVILDKIAIVVQYEYNIKYGKIARLCNVMTNPLDSPLKRLAYIFSSQDECYDANYNNFVKKYQNTSWDSAATSVLRQWYYQSCMEFGYFQTTSYKSTFGSLFSLDFYINQCIDSYGDYHDKKILDSRIRRADIMYGGQLLDVRNVIFMNGDIDPWRFLSVLKDLNAFSPIVIKGASHCNDMYGDEVIDSDDLKKARARIRDIIGKWITSE